MSSPGIHHHDLSDLPDQLPEIFIVGGPKCGTTSLFDWLARHPGTYLPAKEPNFLSRDVFDARTVPGALSDWNAYLGRLCPPEAEGRLTGESTPRYFYSDMALDVLSRHPSLPKAIAVLRNPVDLVHSLHGQMVRQGVETETDFARAWERAKARGNNPEAWRNAAGRMDRRLDYPMFGQLGTRLAAFHAAVPPDRRRVLILEEDLSRDPVFADLLAFLGLPPAKIDLTRSNERIDLRAPSLHRVLVRLRDAGRRGRVALGLPVVPSRPRRKTGMLGLLTRLNTRRGASSAPSLSPQMRAQLVDLFAPEVARVEAELGRSVMAWRDWHVTAGEGPP